MCIPYITGSLLVGMVYPFFNTEEDHTDSPLYILTEFVLAPRCGSVP